MEQGQIVNCRKVKILYLLSIFSFLVEYYSDATNLGTVPLISGRKKWNPSKNIVVDGGFTSVTNGKFWISCALFLEQN